MLHCIYVAQKLLPVYGICSFSWADLSSLSGSAYSSETSYSVMGDTKERSSTHSEEKDGRCGDGLYDGKLK